MTFQLGKNELRNASEKRWHFEVVVIEDRNVG